MASKPIGIHQGMLLRRRDRRRVHPSTHRIVKFMPTNPPSKGDTVLVDGERCRVVKAKVGWEGRVWTIRSMVVEPLG